MRVHGWLFVLPRRSLPTACSSCGRSSRRSRTRSTAGTASRRAKWVGLGELPTVFSDPELVGVLGHAFELIIFFTGIPVVLGLVVAAVTRRIARSRSVTFH